MENQKYDEIHDFRDHAKTKLQVLPCCRRALRKQDEGPVEPSIIQLEIRAAGVPEITSATKQKLHHPPNFCEL